MKRCPECRRDYYDDSLLYCLDDGNALLEGPASDRSEPGAIATGLTRGEPQTAILSEPPASAGGQFDEAMTRALTHTTEAAAEPRDTSSGLSEKHSFSAHRAAKPLIAAAVAVVVLVGGFFGYRYFSAAGSKQIGSIAIMPFENRSSDADTDYLSDGLAESLIFRLTQIPDLRVSPTSSVMRYKGKETDVAKIAAELGVDAVMTGRLTKRGDNLNITVELVDARTNKSLWGEQYERKLSELLTTQREMVTEIVGKLQLKLSGESEQKLTKNYTDNPEAYQLYLQGRHQWNKRETKAFEKAVVFFKQAIEKDPNYALAYSGIADTYSLFPAYGNFRPKEYMPQAKQAALKALELDPNLAEAHASLGEAIFYYDYDWAGAEKAFKRAIELNPKYATARQWYGELLSLSGRQDEAIREMSKALELDPFSMIINRQMVSVLQQTKRFDEAFLQNKKINELFPNEEDLHFTNSFIFEAQGKYTEAFEELLLTEKAGGAKPEEIQQTKNIYEKGGWQALVKRRGEENLKFFNDNEAKDKNEYVLAINYAYAYADLKDKDKTIEYLNKAYDERSMAVLNLKVIFKLDFVRDDPRFKELVKRVGFPE